MPANRILLTNCWLADRAGTELYVRDVALALARAGRQPMVFSPILGEVAAELRQAGIPVTDDLAAPMATPDLIHGHHGFETLAALSRFPNTPGIYVQHDASAWQDEPPHHARLLRYLAVDELCRERVVAAGIPVAATTVIANSVDLVRFARRGPLPATPRRALVLTNSPGETFVPAIRQACEERGIELDVLGMATGRPVSPEDELGQYDVVFAKARTALEAMAVGCAVVVCDRAGIAGLVTSEDLSEWRRWNFGRRLLNRRHEASTLVGELARYDSDDASACTDFVREHCGLDSMVAQLTEVYDGVVKEFADQQLDHRAELVSVAPQLARLGPLQLTSDRHGGLTAHAAHLDRHIAYLEAERSALGAEVEQGSARARGLESEVAGLQTQQDELQAQLHELQASRAAARARADQLEEAGRAQAAASERLANEVDRLSSELADRQRQRAAFEATLTFRVRDRVLRSWGGKALVKALRRGRS